MMKLNIQKEILLYKKERGDKNNKHKDIAINIGGLNIQVNQ